MADHPSKVAYDAANTVQIKMKLNKNTDSDIIKYLNESNNKQGKIKEALRAYMVKEYNMEKNLKWAVIDESNMDGFLEVYHSKEDALAAADAEWEHLSEYDKDQRDSFCVGLVNVEYVDGSWDYSILENGCVDADVYEVAKRYK